MRVQSLAILCIITIVMCGNVYVWYETQPTWDDITSNILADPPDAEMGALFAGILSLTPMVGIGLTPAPRHRVYNRFLAGCWFACTTLLVGMIFVISDTVGYVILMWPTVAGLGGVAIISTANGIRQIATPRLAA